MTAGKSALLVAGAGFGVLRGLRLLGDRKSHAAGRETLEARIDTIHTEVIRLADQTEDIQAKLDQMVTRSELSHTMDRVFGGIEGGMEAKFEQQARCVEALRTMIRQTDELLQRVLDGLESLKTGDDAGRAWDLSQARG